MAADRSFWIPVCLARRKDAIACQYNSPNDEQEHSGALTKIAALKIFKPTTAYKRGGKSCFIIRIANLRHSFSLASPEQILDDSRASLADFINAARFIFGPFVFGFIWLMLQ